MPPAAPAGQRGPGRSRRRAPRRWAPALIVAGAAALAAPIPARAVEVPCPGLVEAARCSRVVVPLDRSGAVPGNIPLLVARVPTQGSRSGALVVLTGGPGQPAVRSLAPIFRLVREAADGRDVVVLDQRGTGASGSVLCPTLDDAVVPGAAVAGCAASLGSRRPFYTTADSVEDLEAVRRQLGSPRLALVGVSYGTKVAQAYAARHPAGVERMVLDSVVPAEGPDPFLRSSLQATPAVLRDLCRGRLCRRVTPDPARDLARLAARLRERPLRGVTHGPRGGRRRVTATEADLAGVLVRGDLDPFVRLQTPGAIRSALAGDPAPFLRLAAGAGGAGDSGGVDTGLYVATVCQEGPAPWRRDASGAERLAQARAAAAALGAGQLGPFGPRAVALSPQISLCARWPETAEPPASPAGPAPDVPVLAIAGGGDVRTPVEDARAIAARYARGRLLVVPRAGHSVLSSTRGPCAVRQLRRFLADLPVRACPPEAALVTPFRTPARLAGIVPARGVPGRRGRVVAAVRLTLTDTLVAAASREPGRSGVVGGGGLRGGRYVVSPTAVRLFRVSVVRGVRVSGRLEASPVLGFFGRLRVEARGASGTVLASGPNGLIVGTLGGRPVASLGDAASPPPASR